MSDEAEREHTVAALRAHVLSSGDDDYGPADAFPPGFDGADLDEHVVFRE